MEGIEYYLTPDLNKLKEPSVSAGDNIVVIGVANQGFHQNFTALRKLPINTGVGRRGNPSFFLHGTWLWSLNGLRFVQ